MRFYGSKSPTRTNPHPPRTQTNGDQWQIQDFPRGGAPTPKVGVLTYFFGQKLYENERIWTPGGRPWRPLRSATGDRICSHFEIKFIKLF